MAETYSAGVVTAYGAAVRGGYTGTYEQFCAEQASFAASARQVAEDRAAVEQLAETFEDQTVPAAVGQVNQAGAAQVQAVQDAGADEESDISAAGTTQVAAVNAAGSTQVTAVQAAGAAQVTAVQGAGSTQVAAVNAAGATQVDAVEDKGAEVLASIPQDYSALSGDVDDLKSALNDINGQTYEILTEYFPAGNQLFDRDNADVHGYYIVGTNIFTSNSGLYGYFIPVAVGEKYTISNNTTYSAFTRSRDTSIKAVEAFTTRFGDGPTTKTVPDGAKYLYVAIQSSAFDSLMVNKGETGLAREDFVQYCAKPYTQWNQFAYKVNDLESKITESEQLFDYYSATEQAYYLTASPWTKYSHTGLRGEYIKIEPGKTYTISGATHWAAFVNATSDTNAISAWTASGSSADTKTAPYNANYLFVSCTPANTAVIIVNEGLSAITYESRKEYLNIPDFDDSKYNFMYVKDGKVRCNASTNSVTAYYAGVDVGENATEIRSSFIWEPQGSSSGVAGFIIQKNGISKVSQITDLSLHLTVTNNRIKLDVLGDIYGTYYYQTLIDETITAQALDGTTLHKLIMSVNTSTDTVTVTYDGTAYTGTFTGDENIAHLTDVIGRYAQFEHYGMGTRESISMPMFTSFLVKTSEYVVCDTFDREDGILTTTPQGHPYAMINSGFVNRVLADW